MNNFITNSDINSLENLNSTFMALPYAQLNLYSTSEKQGWQKTDNLLQLFGLLHKVKKYQNSWFVSATLLPLLEI